MDFTEEELRKMAEDDKELLAWEERVHRPPKKKLDKAVQGEPTLENLLGMLTNNELIYIGYHWELQHLSKLNKQGLIEVLCREMPERLTEKMNYLPLEPWMLLEEVALNGGTLYNPQVGEDIIKYFRKTGLLLSGTLEGRFALMIPQELVEPIQRIIKDTEAEEKVYQNDLWIRILQGLLFYYGVIDKQEVRPLLQRYVDVDEEQSTRIYSVIREYAEFEGGFQRAWDYYTAAGVSDYSLVLEEQAKRPALDFFTPTLEQLLKLSEEGYRERTVEYNELAEYLMKHFGVPLWDSEDMVDNCVKEIKNDHPINDVLQQRILSRLRFEDMEQIQEVTGLLVNLHNNTRMWSLKGHSPREVREKGLGLQRPTRKQKVKVGRNDPCPCGSGKKYKKCCGRYDSHLRLV